MDEYTLLIFFIVGVVVEAAVVQGTLRGLGGVFIIALCAGAAAWVFIEKEGDFRLERGLLFLIIFIIAFAALYRDKLMPAISIPILWHYTFLFYYVAWIMMRYHSVHATIGAAAVSLLPLAGIVLVSVFPKIRVNFVKFLCYGWFLTVLTFITACQFSFEDLAKTMREEGSPLSLAVRSLAMGTVFLYVASNIFFLFMATPFPQRRNLLLDTLLGGSDDTSRRYRAAMSRKMGFDQWSGFKVFLIVGHAAVLSLNIVYTYIPHALMVNVSIASMVMATRPLRTGNRHSGTLVPKSFSE